MAKKKRYVEDGKIVFYELTVQLRSQPEPVIVIRDHSSSNLKFVAQTFRIQANEAFKHNLESFRCVMVEDDDPAAKKYCKANNIHLPNSEQIIIDIPLQPEQTDSYIPPRKDPYDKTPKYKRKSNEPLLSQTSIGELAAMRRKNEEGTRG